MTPPAVLRTFSLLFSRVFSRDVIRAKGRRPSAAHARAANVAGLRRHAYKFGWLLGGLICWAAQGQTPSIVIFIEVDGYQQQSAAGSSFVGSGFIADVDFSSIPATTTSVTIKKPNGSSITMQRQPDNSFSYSEYFATSALMRSAYPNGTYQVSITGGGTDNTISVPATFTPVTSTKITNFDQLQNITSPSATVTWTAVPKTGDQDSLAWELMDSHDVELSYADIPDPRQTSFVVNDLPAGTSLQGALAYVGYTITTATNGSTTLAVGSGFSLIFPIYRAAGAPAAPKLFGAYASRPGEVTLTWQAPADSDLSGYTLERSSSNTFPSTDTVKSTLPAQYTSYIDAVGTTATSYYYRLTANNPYGDSPSAASNQVQTLNPTGSSPSRLANIATRARCSTGENVTIGGFVVSGTEKKRVLIRAVGPSLQGQGISAAELLKDPTMSVYRGSTVIATNDDWTTNTNAAAITTVASQLGAVPLSSDDTGSSALLIDLDPGAYTFVVNGKNNTSGIVLLEVYDANVTSAPRFVNIATRANSASGAGVTIGGFVITGEVPKQVLLRAVGPTLASYGLTPSSLLADPVIELHRGAPIIATNDNWSTSLNSSSLGTVGSRLGAGALATTDTKSAVLLITLPPGVYSFLAYDRSNSSGIVIVEVYDAD